MVLANYLGNINTVPAWLKHAQDIGYTVVDLVAPLFIFAIGLTYSLSFNRRKTRDGDWTTYNHIVSRYLSLIGIGLLITLVGVSASYYTGSTNWGLFQAIGTAGLIALMFIQIDVRYRWIFGVILLGVYQFLLDRFWLQQVLDSAHNGPYGALSWGAMLILSTCYGEMYQQKDKQRWFPVFSLLATILGILLSFSVPLSKNRASASYVLLSVGLSGLMFNLFHALNMDNPFTKILSAWGKNPLLLYLLHGVFLGIFLMMPGTFWYIDAPYWLIIIQASVLLILINWICFEFNKRGWFLNL